MWRGGSRLEELAHFPRGRERVVCRPKDEEEGVTLGVDFGAAVPRERLPQGAAVVGQQVDVTVSELAQEPRRSLDVGEEKRQPAVGQLAHGAVRP
jgi:hypothetical protein